MYFINDKGYSIDLDKFKQMYGNDASNIDTQNMLQVSKTMNSKFLEKTQ